MIKSMTGYGTHTIVNNDFDIKIDIKSVNNRYLDIQIKGPKFLFFLDDEIKKAVSNVASRGKIDVFVDIKSTGKNNINLEIDYFLLDLYKGKIDEISKYLEIGSDFNIFDLLLYDKEILSNQRIDLSINQLFIETLNDCLEVAVANFLEMKLQEGYNIQYDLNNKLDELSAILTKIESLSENTVKNNVDLLKNRIEDILSQQDIFLDEDRLMNEIVFYSDKLSIDEEIVRLKSHLDLFMKIIEDNVSSGKKMDFLIQEMNREANTIGSKSASIEITNYIIEIKSIIEKMREQVQNIE